MDGRIVEGVIITQVSEFIVNDGDVAFIIKNALKKNGYNIEAKPLQDSKLGFFIGENLKVFRME